VSTSTVIVTPRVILRNGIASFLQGTRYKVVASAAKAAELASGRVPREQQTLAIVGIDQQNGNLDEVSESIRLLRSLSPDGKVVLVAETHGGIDPRRALALSPDACIFNLNSRDALIKVLELVFLDQRVFVFAKSIATTPEKDVDVADPPRGSQSDKPSRLGMNGHNLSPRERQVLGCLAQGNSNKVIARLHNLSEATVKAHLKAILRKIKVHNRTQAAIWAIQNGFQNYFQNTAELSPTHPDLIARAADMAP
jgi:two-component system, NarL family, nitrate/nitrite response regulator NarL